MNFKNKLLKKWIRYVAEKIGHLAQKAEFFVGNQNSAKENLSPTVHTTTFFYK